MSKFEEKMAQYIKLTEENLLKYNDHTEANAPQKELIDAMNYSLEAGGKRVRPALVYAFCEALGGNIESAIAPACAIEMIHTFSLIHDDLPCMDDDDFRRGKPSCHKAFPENIALLAGDALNTLAFEVISNAALDGRITAEKAVMLISVLSKSVGAEGMIGGQVIDLLCEGKEVDIETLNTLQSYKTGALIEAACVMGVILAGKYDLIPAAADYASAVGRAFQIVDDLLDVSGTFEELGKPIGSDSEQGKCTYVSLLGENRSRQIAAQLTMQALGHLTRFENNEFLSELTDDLLSRRN